jgi:GEVED domain/Secretion system C-terminal sorting domain
MMKVCTNALLSLLLSALFLRGYSQVSAYTFTEATEVYTAVTGTTSTATGDDGTEDLIPIGFNFIFGGTSYTTFSISTNGFIKLGSVISGFHWTNSLSNTAIQRPLIAPFWDDNNRNTGSIQYLVSGTAPNRILEVGWNNINIGGSGATSGTNLASYKLRLYETSNNIEFIYGSVLNPAGTLTASVGINDNTSFLSVTPAASSTVSSATADNSISATTNLAGKKYIFTAPVILCNATTSITVSGITATSANINWTPVGGATGYEYAVTNSATPPASGTANAGTSVSVPGLSQGLLYYAHVRTACAGGLFSLWTTQQFNTPCNPLSIPYTENFDGVTAPALPTCIVTQDLNAGTTWNNGTTDPRSAPNCMIYNFNTPLPANDWFYTAPLSLTAGVSYRLSFYYKARLASFPEGLEVRYGTGNNSGAMTTTLFTNNSITNTTYQQGVADFTPASSGIYFIGFHAISLADQFELNVDDISVTLSPSCGAPTALTTVLSSNTAGTASWTAPSVGTPVGYEYVIDNTVADPAGAGTANAGTSVAFSGLTAFTTYYLHVRTNCGAGGFSGWSTLSFVTLINDAACGAIPLTLNGPQECANDSIATAVGDPSFTCSTPNNTLWYRYTPTTTGVVNIRTEIPALGNPLEGWIGWYTATGSCPSLSLTQVANGCDGISDFGGVNGQVDTLVSPVLTAGTTYYIMVDGIFGDFGNFCLNLIPPPPPPPCVTNISPANAAVGVAIPGGSTLFSWNAAAGATSYDVFFGTVNPPVTNLGNIATTSVAITGLDYNTTYYWYVVPRNSSNAATGCDANTTSFTTENPTNCIPLYVTGCSQADSLTFFSLKGEPGSTLINNSGGTCSVTPLAYTDYTSIFAPVVMERGNAYSGFMRTADANDYASIWIDYNDNGFFENSERVLNNLRIGTTRLLYSIFIPGTAPTGTHRMRVRIIYSFTPPTVPTDPCNTFGFGETEDYNVTITNTGAASRAVATGTPGACITVSATTIDPASNNTSVTLVPLLDSLNNFVAYIYPDGNDLGRINSSLYVHAGPIRQDPKGIYYLDRNLTVTPQRQPTGTYRLRIYLRTAELNALIAQPGSGVTSIFDLNLTKTIQDTCSRGIGPNVPNGQIFFSSNPGNFAGDRFIDFTGLTSFSTFFLHGSSVPLPVKVIFAGEKQGGKNLLRWTTTSETNNKGFYLEGSANGQDFVSLGFIPSQAVNGNSSIDLHYNFTDNNPAVKSYYRLKIISRDDKIAYSNIILLRGEKPVKLTIGNLYPNPTADVLNIVLDAPVRDKVTLVITDLAGKIMKQEVVQVEAGTNTVDTRVNGLPAGTYIIKAICANNCESTVGRFVKK